MAESLVGRVLGSYRIERELGAGGMGTVYAGKHARTGRTYAVKVLLPEQAQRRDALRRFRREAEALSALGHAHIVAIHDFDETADGLFFLAMDLLEGEDLAHRIERVGRLAWRDAAVLVDAVASAIEAAHGLGMIHRDLKPSNVFLARTAGAAGERPVLLDFGLARALEDDAGASRVTATGTVLGTPQYMSPEQAQGHPLDPRSDVWALGVLLYETCAGRAPFVAPTIASTFVQILTAPTPSLRASGAPVPEAIDQIVSRALEKSPSARFASVAAMRRALSPLLSDGPRGARTFGGSGADTERSASLAPTLASAPIAAHAALAAGTAPTLALSAPSAASATPMTVALPTGPTPAHAGGPRAWLALALGVASLGTLAVGVTLFAFFGLSFASGSGAPPPARTAPSISSETSGGSPIAIAPTPVRASAPSAAAPLRAPAPSPAASGVAPGATGGAEPTAERPTAERPTAAAAEPVPVAPATVGAGSSARAVRSAAARETSGTRSETREREPAAHPGGAEEPAGTSAAAAALTPPVSGPPPALVRATERMAEGDFAGCLRELSSAGTSAPVLGARMSCANSAGDRAALTRTCELLHQHHPRHAYTGTCDSLLGVMP